MEIGYLVLDYLFEHDVEFFVEGRNDARVDDKGGSLCVAYLVINRTEGNLDFFVDLVKNSD